MTIVIKLEVWDGKADSYDRLGLNEEYMVFWEIRCS